MKKISDKQKAKNKELASIKKALINENGYKCEISREYSQQLDLCHILPKSIYPEFYTCKWNFFLARRDFHMKFDNEIDFRQLQIHLFQRAYENAPLEAKRYFQFNNN